MSLPYETATSGRKALSEIEKVLRSFGCSKFGSMTDVESGEVLVQFEYRGLPVSVRASVKGYAAALLKRNPYTYRTRSSRVEHERKANEQAAISVYSVLRDWVKGQITAVETGVLSFEGAFLGQIMLPSGKTVLEEAKHKHMLPEPDSKIIQFKSEQKK